MSNESKAVFLSYASQDADAAKRICEALRAAGIEVWFDQSELVGGDAWDQKIRKQIRECALLIPVISKTTQSRREAYFRLEWKLAEERTHLMAKGTPFLLPVTIDETSDRDALVPDSFLAVQWTVLRSLNPGGPARREDDPALAKFAARVKKLLDGEAGAGRPRPADRGEGAPPPNKGGSRWLRPVLVSAVIVVAVLAGTLIREHNGGGTRSEKTAVSSTESSERPAAKPAPDLKSIAVLPFKNMSADKGNAYLSDGISEELQNVLSKIPGLRVAGWASSQLFRDRIVPPQEIGRELNVAHFLEGSVEKFGNQVRIRARLTRVATATEIWNETYPARELKDVFALEDEITRDIAGKLQVALALPAGSSRHTVNPEAYQLLLEARYYRQLRTYPTFDRAEKLLLRALALDPEFAEAHAELAQVYSVRAMFRMSDGFDEPREDSARAVTEAEHALALDPTLADAYSGLGFIYVGTRRWPEAEQAFQKAVAANPNSATAHMQNWSLQQLRGRLDLALAEADRTIELDPLSFTAHALRSTTLMSLGRYDEALAASDRSEANRPAGTMQGWASRMQILWYLGRHDDAVKLAREILAIPTMETRFEAQGVALWTLQRAGLRDEVAVHAERLFRLWPAQSYLRGMVLVVLGRFDEALPFLERTTPLAISRLYFGELFDPYRDDPRFAQLMVKLGCAEEYRTAQETLARMQREGRAAK